MESGKIQSLCKAHLLPRYRIRGLRSHRQATRRQKENGLWDRGNAFDPRSRHPQGVVRKLGANSMTCDKCGIGPLTDAEQFLHQKVHGEPWGVHHGLSKLPFVLFPAVARAMQDYADKQKSSLVSAHIEYERGPEFEDKRG
jgi:hypothetical protein